MPVRALVGAMVRGITAPLNGLWQVLNGWVEGWQARLFERERRMTLERVPPTLSAGTTIYDHRADGSVLLISIPPDATRVETAADGSRQNTGAAGRCVSGGRPVDGIGGRLPGGPSPDLE